MQAAANVLVVSIFALVAKFFFKELVERNRPSSCIPKGKHSQPVFTFNCQLEIQEI